MSTTVVLADNTLYLITLYVLTLFLGFLALRVYLTSHMF